MRNSFIPKEKLSKRQKRALNLERRVSWGFAPVTRKVESKKVYDRKKLRSRLKNPDGAFLCAA